MCDSVCVVYNQKRTNRNALLDQGSPHVYDASLFWQQLEDGSLLMLPLLQLLLHAATDIAAHLALVTEGDHRAARPRAFLLLLRILECRLPMLVPLDCRLLDSTSCCCRCCCCCWLAVLLLDSASCWAAPHPPAPPLAVRAAACWAPVDATVAVAAAAAAAAADAGLSVVDCRCCCRC